MLSKEIIARPNCKVPLFANKLRDLKRRRRKLERSMKIRPLTWQTSISTNLSGIYTLLFLRSVALRIIDQLATFHLFRKFLKKTVVDQSLGHYEENGLLSDSQSARRRFSSTKTALLKVQNDSLVKYEISRELLFWYFYRHIWCGWLFFTTEYFTKWLWCNWHCS